MLQTDRPPPWKELCTGPLSLIGMVHVPALPGTPRSHLRVSELVEVATEEAVLLAGCGFDAIIIENMHDTPYVHGDRLGPETTACMTAVAASVSSRVSQPLGIQILSGGNAHAIAVAQAAGGSFIRCENFVFSHVADEGLLVEAEAGPLLRYRRGIGADEIGVFCDIKKKHASHALTADVSIADAVQAAGFFGADAVVITGSHTGQAASPEDVRDAAAASDLPVLVGSGVTSESIARYDGAATAVIVGSDIKRDGLWSNPIDPRRAESVVKARDRLSRV